MAKAQHMLIVALGVALMGGASLGESATPTAAAMTAQEETYDLLFRTGTLDAITAPLSYERVVRNSARPEQEARDSGRIELGFEQAEGSPRAAVLSFWQDARHRGLGSFPASVGNPMIMYFIETVVRDMAETAGGSAFYIRNRVKEALVEPAGREDLTVVLDGRAVPAVAVTLHPFEGDPNSDRMAGFGDLALRVVMSEAAPGWYLGLSAEAPGVYRSEIVLSGAELPGALQ